MRIAALLLLLGGMAAACGQRGELYLRDSPPPGTRAASAETAKPPAASPAPAEEGTEKKR